MTQREITYLKNQVWEDHINRDATEPSTIQLLDLALERLEKLEAAVAWHGWDEVPVSSKECYFIDIEIIDSKRKTTCIVYNKETKLFTESALSSHILLYGDEMKKEGYVGWRYPVGDLSE